MSRKIGHMIGKRRNSSSKAHLLLKTQELTQQCNVVAGVIFRMPVSVPSKLYSYIFNNSAKGGQIEYQPPRNNVAEKHDDDLGALPMGMQPKTCFQKPSFIGEFLQYLTVPAVGIWFLHVGICVCAPFTWRILLPKCKSRQSPVKHMVHSTLVGMDPAAQLRYSNMSECALHLSFCYRDGTSYSPKAYSNLDISELRSDCHFKCNPTRISLPDSIMIHSITVDRFLRWCIRQGRTFQAVVLHLCET